MLKILNNLENPYQVQLKLQSYETLFDWNPQKYSLGYANNLANLQQTVSLSTRLNNPTSNSTLTSSIVGTGASLAGKVMQDKLSLMDDTEGGRALGTLFSSGINSSVNTITNNAVKGSALFEDVSKNGLSSMAGAGAGLAANYLGLGINSLGGDSRLSRGIGGGVSTGLGTVGGTVATNLVKYGTVGAKTADGSKLALFGKGAGSINPYGLAMLVAGSVLGGFTGKSNEYAGKYGSITRGMDTVYDIATAAANFIPVGGQLISGAMALNKGLSNLFGSTDAMTKTDAILGSAFMPAPVKWINAGFGKTTSSFDGQSWQRTAKTNNFMGDAFGDLGDKLAKARTEANKKYGLLSNNARKKAQRNIDFANNAWDKLLAMADQNELQSVRSSDMTSINNLRYAQMIQGTDDRTLIGKQGMKILNNATNHNIGMRLLSGAALIDNKQMILSNLV